MDVTSKILVSVILFAVGFLLAFWIRTRQTAGKIRAAEDDARKIIKEAERQSETIQKEAKLLAKDQLYQMKVDFENETKEVRSDLKSSQKRLSQKEENLDRKTEQLERRDNNLSKKEHQFSEKEKYLQGQESKYKELIQQEKTQLERISGLTGEEAKELLIKAMENEARYEAAKLIKRIENESREQADRKAKKIIATAIQRYAGDYVAEKTVSVVNLPSDEMKGRIIGREGRNIRALEA
ncbi:MAG: DUF3552 domain-containing protein, partial [Deltaproteobacteria bacterium]|nr:DUF3552 domain-containing protein [Deltaproteobacteria bacterium]